MLMRAVAVSGGVELSVGRSPVDPGSRPAAGAPVPHLRPEDSHGAFPVVFPRLHPLFAASVSLHQPQAGQAGTGWKRGLVRDVGDPLSVRGPAGMEVIVTAEGQLVGRPAGGGQYVEVVELVGGAAGGGVDEALPSGETWGRVR